MLWYVREQNCQNPLVSLFLVMESGEDVQDTEIALCKGKEKRKEKELIISLGPQVAIGEKVFCVCHTFVSFNDAFVSGTDLSSKEIIYPCNW